MYRDEEDIVVDSVAAYKSVFYSEHLIKPIPLKWQHILFIYGAFVYFGLTNTGNGLVNNHMLDI